MSFKLSDIFNFGEIKNLCESFTELTNLTTAILDLNGNIHIATGWQPLCMEFHRVNELTRIRCLESDTILASKTKKEKHFNIYKCKNGLVDIAFPIIIENHHIGNFFTGQFFLESPDLNFFSRQANEFGFDPKEYLNAVDKIPIFSEEYIEKIKYFILQLVNMIGNNELSKLKNSHYTQKLESQNQELLSTRHNLQTNEEKYRYLFEHMAQGVVYQDISGKIISANDSALNILGLTLDQLNGRTSLDPKWKTIKEDGSAFPGDEHPAMIALQTGKAIYNVVMGIFHPSEEKYKWILVSAIPQFKNEETKPYQVFTTFTDITEQIITRNKLRASESRLRNYFDLGLLGMAITSTKKGWIEVNDALCDILGYAHEELILKTWTELTHPDDLEKDLIQFNRTLSGEIDGYKLKKRFIHRDGHIVYTQLSVRCIRSEDDSAEYFLALINNITDLKITELQIQESLAEKEVLLRELYHRTKNNMQVISAYLQLQSFNSDDLKLNNIINDVVMRIQSMSLVHHKLYQSKNLSRINIREYIEELTSNVLDYYDIPKNKIELLFDIENIEFLIDTAIPFGLVINELITNSFKHAFPDEANGIIRIKLFRINSDSIMLHYSDNGIGLPENFNIKNNNFLGLLTSKNIIEQQLSGSIQYKNINGLKFEIMIKDNIYYERI